MDRIPPTLSYLTIYNPSLRPIVQPPPDDEDAEEQAHILFYTSKEQAVSRDRMLRQIGLAKALVNFAGIFNQNDICNNVHSQSRRIIMVSPEPNFWINAAVEVAKVLRDPMAKNKGKSKEKPKSNSGKKDVDESMLYDYEDGSVHDVALRADIMRAYERFKLTHGSFTTILSTLGQQALELQLERFFTVWAWSWDLEHGHSFGEHLGTPRHPSLSPTLNILDEYASHLSDNISPIVIFPPYAIPSSRFISEQYPSSLIRHLTSIIPHTKPSTRVTQNAETLSSSTDTIRGQIGMSPRDSAKSDDNTQNTFLGIPNMNMNMSMDMRKWNWPGYLTFGKGSSKTSNQQTHPEEKEKLTESMDAESVTSQLEVTVNKEALEDAMSSDGLSVSGSDEAAAVESENESSIVTEPSQDNETSSDNSGAPIDREEPEEVQQVTISSTAPPEEKAEPPTPPFSTVSVHLHALGNPSATRLRKVHYLVRNQYMVALLGVDEIGDLDIEQQQLEIAARRAFQLFDDIQIIIQDSALTIALDTGSSAAKILQPIDQYIILNNSYTLASSKFNSKSNHLYDARALQEADPEITEIFSRGQNPQHWHIAKRGLGGHDNMENANDEVYLEVFRKEASLADVDNVLAGIVRKSGLVDGYVS